MHPQQPLVLPQDPVRMSPSSPLPLPSSFYWRRLARLNQDPCQMHHLDWMYHQMIMSYLSIHLEGDWK